MAKFGKSSLMGKLIKHRIELLIILIVLLAGRGWDHLSGEATSPDFQQKTLALEDGTELRYTIFLPKALSTKKDRPLVLALHYGGRVTPYFGKDILTYLVEPGLRELQAIMVSPDCPGRGWNNPVSEKAVLSLLDYVIENYPVYKNKIVVTGYSMGATGTWYLISRHPELFSAAIPISGLPREEISLEGNKTPVYAIHSENDELIAFSDVNKFVDEWKAKGLNVHLEVIRGTGHYEFTSYVQPLRKTVRWIKKVWSAREQATSLK